MKRKTKTKQEAHDFNPLQAVTISDIGTSNDPCFGKYHSEDAMECKRCGDQLLCAIILQQKNSDKVKSLTPFKDVELDRYIDPLVWEPSIIKIIKRSKNRRLTPNSLLNRSRKILDPAGNYDDTQIKSTIMRLVKGSSKIISIKENGIRYIKLK